MSLKDEMEKALTIFRKPEVIKPDSIAGLRLPINQEPSIAGRIGTVRHYAPPEQKRPDGYVDFTRANLVEAIATDQLEFPRACGWTLEDWMGTYVVRDQRLYWAGGIKLND